MLAALCAGGDALAAEHLRVGEVTLEHCQTPAPWCGRLERALDPAGAVPGSVPVYFEYWPHTGSAAATGTLVATEGGPGYPATETRDEYLALFAPLRVRLDVVIVDNRGTGRSGAVDCRALQQAPALTAAAIGACGRSLGPAAPLYSTALAADDLAAVLDALGIGRINLYGDSYGTYFAQVFALRHPDRLRSLVLDGAYPLEGPDYPWYPHYAPAMRDKFNLACARAPDCSALAGSSLDHIAPALAALRTRPFRARARRGDGTLVGFTADAGLLATVMFGSAPAYATVRETDAAARAFQTGDQAPLLRLMAEALYATDSRDPTHSPTQFSAGLAAAVFCQDTPQIFDMTLDPARRAAARDAALAQRRARAPDTYAPFSIDEYRRMPIDYAFIDECVAWPVVRADSPAKPLVPAGPYPPVPVLVVSGELDNMTSVADGAAAAAHFPRAHHVVIANGFHVNALPHARSECGAILVRRFMADLDTGDQSCAALVPPLRLVRQFAQTLHELVPAQALPGNEANEEQLRAVTGALLTCEDAIARARDNGAGPGAGLRGGTFVAVNAGAGYRLQLDAVRFTKDLPVSGTVQWPGRTGEVRGKLVLGGSAAPGTLEVNWPEGLAASRATVRGTLRGKAVVAEAPAP
ncbi:MAG TPA: alpha/beta hydrolase [Steroidobacteraceae bacterium]|nr:alpha/beta hydrolase [Steroidobacteraceae bacterium]